MNEGHSAFLNLELIKNTMEEKQVSFNIAKELGCRIINIAIVEENRVLRKWYELNGAIHIGTKKYDFFPFTCGYMKKEL